MSRHKKVINNTNVPQDKIEMLARCFLSDIIDFYDSEKGQREFAEWKSE